MKIKVLRKKKNVDKVIRATLITRSIWISILILHVYSTFKSSFLID